MLRIATALALLLGMLAAAGAEPMTIRKCLEIMAALNVVDQGHERVVKEAAGERVVREQFLLPGTVRLALSLNMSSLRPITEAAERTRGALLTQIGAGKPIGPDTQEMRDFNAEWEKVIDTEKEVSLLKIKAKDLLGEPPRENAIPSSALALLMPILDTK
jgi:hypothetical protein